MTRTWTFAALSANNGGWAALKSDWQKQCEDAGEEFGDYASSTMPVLGDLAENPEPKAGVFGLLDGGKYLAACQLNVASLPHTFGLTLRVRHVLVSPFYDFNDVTQEQLGDLMGKLLYGIHEVSNEVLRADHIKIHLRSPLEMTYFRALGGYLGASGAVKSVESKGAWIYLTK